MYMLDSTRMGPAKLCHMSHLALSETVRVFAVHPNTSITIMIEMYYYDFTKDAEVWQNLIAQESMGGVA